MSVGSLLTQPQRLPRLANATPVDAGLGDLAKLGIGVTIDTLKGGHILETFEAAGEAASARFVTQAEHGFDHARERLAAMIEAPLAALVTKAQELGSVDGPDAALAAAHDILTTVVALAVELTIDHIRQHLGELLDIIETDLGLTPTFLETELWALFDDMIDRLEHITPESNASLRSNRLQVIAALRSIKRAAEHEFHFPQIPLEQAAEELFDLIRRTGITSEAARVACVGANLVQVADAGRDLLHAVPFTGFGTGSVSAGTVPASASTDVYLWYPSWLANNHRPFKIELALVLPGDDVVKTAAGQIVQRNTWRTDTLISESSSDWSQVRKTDDSTTTPYSFGTISPESMETIAWVSSIVTNGFELLFHLISLEEGDFASNIVNGTGAAGYGTWKAVKREPAPWWLEGLLFRFGGTFAASFQGVHTKAAFGLCFKEWLTLAGPDYAEMLSYKYFTETARDLLLSILTLINHKPGENGVAHPRNREEIDALRNIIVLIIQNVTLAVGFDRKEWGLIKPSTPSPDYSPMLTFFLGWGVLAGTLVGLVGGTLGCLLGEVMSGDVAGSPTLTKLWYGIPQGVLLNPYWLYLQQEGHTSGGTFNPAGPSDFNGYPTPASASPYKLPYDVTLGPVYVGQANEGLFSHNFNNVDQIYAYDFSMDKNDEILAARAGTVVAFFEGIPDDQTGGAWNYIAIQHDVDDSGANIGSNPQDQGPSGGLIKTVAVYGHGRNGSVSAAFARHVPPVPTGSILNSTVKQGMPIMDAGCTGISFHNHLHMHVVPAPVGGGGTGNTIPFVFSDPDTGDDGALTHFNFYTSANVRRLS